MKDFKWEINLSCLYDLICTIHRCRENPLKKLWSKNKFSANRLNSLDRKSVNENLKSTFQGKNIILVPKVCLELCWRDHWFLRAIKPARARVSSPELDSTSLSGTIYTHIFTAPIFLLQIFCILFIWQENRFPGNWEPAGNRKKERRSQLKSN